MSDGKSEVNQEHVISDKISNTSKIVTSLVAGALAGAVAKTTIAPLDRTKINFQVTNMPFSTIRCIRFLKETIISQGVRALWRGNSATMARILPYAAIQYASHEQFKYLLNRDPINKHLSPGRRYLAGSLAGVTSVACTYPLDMIRARMAVTVRDKYHNIYQVFLKVVKEEGWRTIYRGFTPTVLGSIPYAGSSFFTYETLKKIHSEKYKGRDLTPLERLGFGATAGLFGQSVSYPLDIVRRRMQTAGVTGNDSDYATISQTGKKVIHDEGIIGGLYKGLSLNWIKGPIAVGISFMIFDLTQRNLRKLAMFNYKNS